MITEGVAFPRMRHLFCSNATYFVANATLILSEKHYICIVRDFDVLLLFGQENLSKR